MNANASRTALLSVYDKNGIVEFARGLVGLGFDLVASGGTAKALSEAGLAVRDVSELVGGGAILGHRVVTLSREIHAGILARDTKEDRAELKKLGIPRIDLVCVDMYPLAAEIASPTSTPESVVEKTDIGGPTMLRAAAKGGRIVVADPADRARVLEWLQGGEPEREAFLRDLAAKAEYIAGTYALQSARYLGPDKYDFFAGQKAADAKYGENGWQEPAALYSSGISDPLALDQFELVAGTAPSYNNFADIDRMLQTSTHIAAAFEKNRGKVPFIAVAVKHGNACGAAVGDNKTEVLKKMVAGSTRAIFGGLVMLNFAINPEEAEVLLTYLMPQGRRLLDGIAAPGFSTEAVDMLKRSGDKCRFLANPALGALSASSLDTASRFRYVRGGFLKQPNYTFVLDLSRAEKNGSADSQKEDDLLLAWAVGSTSNSNTVTLVRDGQLLGNGVGQQDRVGGAELAIKRAKDEGHKLADAAAYSDSFFPFPDGPGVLADAGVTAILATSGSKNDQLTRDLCAKRGVALYLLPDSEARGFFGH
jgi:phosphoribosylaminoimidazolecarboxamide formyltransferase/IMP cyclohydrolase